MGKIGKGMILGVLVLLVSLFYVESVEADSSIIYGGNLLGTDYSFSSVPSATTKDDPNKGSVKTVTSSLYYDTGQSLYDYVYYKVWIGYQSNGNGIEGYLNNYDLGTAPATSPSSTFSIFKGALFPGKFTYRNGGGLVLGVKIETKRGTTAYLDRVVVFGTNDPDTEFAPPIPSFTVDKIIPTSITKGESIDIKVTGQNSGGWSPNGSLTLSFPDLNSEGDKSRVQNPFIRNDFPTPIVRQKGDTIYDKDGNKIKAKYVLAEGDYNYSNNKGFGWWNPSSSGVLEVRVTPKTVGKFIIYVRCTTQWLDMQYRPQESAPDPDPNSYSPKDQQGFYVKRYVVQVNPVTNYKIKASHGSNGSIDPEGDVYVGEGSSVTFNATPDFGYVVDRWYVDGQDVGGDISSLTIENVHADKTVSVTFKLNPPSGSETVTLTANKDTYIKEGNPTLNFGNSSTLRVTTDTLDNYGLISFNLGDIPNGSVINDVKLKLYCSYYNGAQIYQIYIAESDSYWSESSVTWNTKPTQGYKYGFFHNVTGIGYQQITNPKLTNLVKDWVNGTEGNYGIYLYGGNNGDNFTFYSSEYSHSSYRPKLIVTYTLPPPDLIITNLYPETSPSFGQFTVGQNVNWHVTVKNNGSGPADSSNVGYYLGTSSTDFSNRINSDSISVLNSGESDTDHAAYSFTASDIGQRYLICKADYKSDIEESSENNNIRVYGPFYVSPEVVPELSVTPASLPFGTVKVGITENLSFKVENVGGGTLIGRAYGLPSSSSFSFFTADTGYRLGTNQTKTITVSFAPTSADNFSGTVNFSGGDGASRGVSGTGQASPAILSVKPSTGLSFSGPQGGPFKSSSNPTYTLQNTGGSSLNWNYCTIFSIYQTQDWVALSPASGTLAAEAPPITVMVSIKSSAKSLKPGSYSEIVAFVNTTNKKSGNGNANRTVILTVTGSSISGTVFLSGGTSSVTDVLLTLSGNSSATTQPDSQGHYSFSGLATGNYTITPSLTNYTFNPAKRVYNPLNSDQTGQNFVGSSSGQLLQFSSSAYSVNEGGGSVTITVVRTGGSAGIITVDYATSDGTARAGSDYTTTSNTLTFSDGETSKTFSVSIINNSAVKGNKTVNLTLSKATGGAGLGSPSVAVLTIVDNDINTTAPNFSNEIPSNGTTTVDTTPAISVDITDTHSGVDLSTITMTVNSNPATPTVTSITGGYRVSYTPTTPLPLDTQIPVKVTADDNAGNHGVDFWSFKISDKLQLNVGWNLIALPWKPKVPYKAQDILRDILDANSQPGKAVEIDRWHKGTWSGHPAGKLFNNFAADVGKGYFVKCSSSGTWTISGSPISSLEIPLAIGWNLVGIPLGTYKAQDVCDEINSQGGKAVEIDRWLKGTWSGHPAGKLFNNFDIEKSKGYFLKCTKASTWSVGGLQMRKSNITATSFTVSWITDTAETGHINYGTEPGNLSNIAYDDRGESTSDDTHYVTISPSGGLTPNIIYYFDIVSGGITYDNGGNHYTCTTGPMLNPPSPEQISGQVYKNDGTTPAEGTIVYITVEDNDGAGSPGSSEVLSSLVDSNGAWYVNISTVRLEDLSAYFNYSSSGDNVKVSAQGAGDGATSQTVDTVNNSHIPDMTLVP